MENSQLSVQHKIPEKWREKYLLKRIGEDDIEMSLEERNEILKSLMTNARFIQIGKHTIMVNTIKSIDPKWGEKNIPPRPKERRTGELIKGTYHYKIENKEELLLWDMLFKERQKNPLLERGPQSLDA